MTEREITEGGVAGAGQPVADLPVADLPAARTARVDVLANGYVGERVASTVVLVRDEDAVVVIDPGMVARRSVILDPLRSLGVDPDEVTDVVISHHHPDHTMNIALFPNCRVHDFWAVYQGDTWDDRPAEGVQLTPSIRLLETPGHTPQDISTVIGTPDGIMVATHAWWAADGPAEDPYAEPESLTVARARILALADLVIPGHGAPFRPTVATPR